MQNANSIALAGGAVAVALIDVLISKNIMSAAEAADVGRRAQNLLEPYALSSGDAAEASRIISDMLIGPHA